MLMLLLNKNYVSGNLSCCNKNYSVSNSCSPNNFNQASVKVNDCAEFNTVTRKLICE